MVKLTKNIRKIFPSLVLWELNLLLTRTYKHLVTSFNAANREELYPKKKTKQSNAYLHCILQHRTSIRCFDCRITAGLEEARANGADGVDDETINGLRAGLMGPVAELVIH